jgi:hypothetical protein
MNLPLDKNTDQGSILIAVLENEEEHQQGMLSVADETEKAEENLSLITAILDQLISGQDSIHLKLPDSNLLSGLLENRLEYLADFEEIDKLERMEEAQVKILLERLRSLTD